MYTVVNVIGDKNKEMQVWVYARAINGQKVTV